MCNNIMASLFTKKYFTYFDLFNLKKNSVRAKWMLEALIGTKKRVNIKHRAKQELKIQKATEIAIHLNRLEVTMRRFKTVMEPHIVSRRF